MFAGVRSWLYFFFKRTGALSSWIASFNGAGQCAAFGARPEGTRLQRMQNSPQWAKGRFKNPDGLYNDLVGMLFGLFKSSPHKIPKSPLPVIRVERDRFAKDPSSGLRLTWLGHSTMLIEVDGFRVLTDPVWGPRTSPLRWIGPKRWYDPLLPLDHLPPLDAILISHDHYDHLDYPTLTAMKAWKVRFITPLGVGAHLSAWGIPEDRITEMDWWDRLSIGSLEIVCTPARHASGRGLADKDRTLWGGFALIGPRHRVYFSGDTGLFSGMKDIGERLGPFDLTLIEAGAYHRSWPDWHIGPEQAVTAHLWVKGKVLIPIHWGLFSLAYHSWTEPVERLDVAAKKRGVKTFVPKPGESIEPATAPPTERWWPQIPWETAEQSPIVSTKVDQK